MKLLTKDTRERLLSNGRRRMEAQDLGHDELDFFPVVKLFTPEAHCIWLLTELNPDDPDIAFGLCDHGLGHPDTGYVSISEIEIGRGPVMRDRSFVADKTLSAYAIIASIKGRIET